MALLEGTGTSWAQVLPRAVIPSRGVREVKQHLSAQESRSRPTHSRGTTHGATRVITKHPLGAEVGECLPGDGDQGGDKLALNSQPQLRREPQGRSQSALN